MERLDKIIATALQISRKDAIALIKRGRIAVNKETIKDPKQSLTRTAPCFFAITSKYTIINMYTL